MTTALHRSPGRDWPAISADEVTLDTALTCHTLAPRALDRLECHPAVQKREGMAYQPLVVVSLDDRPVLMSADTARRLAVRQEGRGREGAAHDLLAAADLAEALSHQLQTEFQGALN